MFTVDMQTTFSSPAGTILADNTNTTEGTEDYVYDYLILGNPGNLGEFLEAMVYITGIVGFLTNLLVMCVLCSTKRFLSKPGYLFLINQNAVDLFSCALVLITYVTWFSGVSSRVKDTIWGCIYCCLVNSEVLLYVGFYTNFFNIVFMAGERLLMIVFPVHHLNKLTHKKAILLIVAGWVTSFLLNIPPMESFDLSENTCRMGYTFNSKKYNLIHGYLIMALTYFLPLIFVVYCYAHMLIVLQKKKSSPMVYPLDPAAGIRKPLSTSQINLMKVMAAITVLYIVTWTPVQVYYFMSNLGVPLSFADAYYYMATVLVIANSFINPFIYISKYKPFRMRVQAILCSKREHVSSSNAVRAISTPLE